MPSKASMLVLIARAARSAAAATCRFARLVEQAALSPEAAAAASHAPDHAAAGDMLLHRSAAAAAPPPAMAAPSPAMDAPNPWTDSRIVTGPSGLPTYKDLSKPGCRVEFEAKEEDLESDEALWALYERWCKAFNQKRDRDEMDRRFNKFKEMVLLVHRTNNANLPYKLGINKFADGKLMEMRANRDWREAKLAKKVGNSSVLWKRHGRFLREVFAEFNVVNGKLFVFFPVAKGEYVGCKKELSVDYEVVSGRLFADLPEGHELVIPDMEFIMRHHR